MGFGIYDLTLSSLFFINSLAILHEQRFLAKYGWDKPKFDDQTVKGKMVQIIYSARTILQIPLIGINVVFILMLILWG
eukprot:UN02995